jgi:nitrogen fixation protein NifB
MSISSESNNVYEKFRDLADNHPCLGHAPNKGRLHLPISPACNIKCRFCTRLFNNYEERPGVARSVIDTSQASNIIDKALELCPEISVVGVAGPGDSLATSHAVNCLKEIHDKYPHLIGCISTNGLALPDRVQDIIDAGISSVTVTVNAVDPEIQAQIIEYIVYEGKLLTGVDAAKILISHQLEGIKALVEAGVFVKVNSVLIPGLNDEHLSEIAQTVSLLGCGIMNIIPLIPQGDFINYSEPTCDELADAREGVERYITVFRHCQHCRADACGLLGKDVSGSLYEDVDAENTFSHG